MERPAKKPSLSTKSDCPRWRHSLTVYPVSESALLAFDELGHFVLQGPILVALAPHLKGEQEVFEIAAKLEGRFSLSEVTYAISYLRRSGYLAQGDHQEWREQAYWELLYRVDQASLSVAKRYSVAIHCLGSLDRHRITERFFNDPTLSPGTPESSLLVVFTDDYNRPELAEINRERLAKEQPWLLVKPVGLSLWVGPLFRNSSDACWECLRDRVQANRQAESYIQRVLPEAEFPLTAKAATAEQLELATEIVRQIVKRFRTTGGHSGLPNTVRSIRLPEMVSKDHPLTKRPQCPVCGNADFYHGRSAQLHLEPSVKRYSDDGGHRTHLPEETLSRYEHHISPITGVIPWLQDLEPDDAHINAYAAGHNFAMLDSGLYTLKKNIRGRSGGKGMTDTQAKVSALCEAMERFSGVFQGVEKRVRSSFRDLGDQAIDPRTLLNYSEKQIQNHAQSNRDLTESRMQLVCPPFQEEREMDWTPVWSLVEERERLVPTAYCYFGHPDLLDYLSVMACGNGCAGGNTLEEAILQATCEIVERDAVGIWWYNRISRPAIDLDSVQHPFIEANRKHLQDRYKREVWCLDLTTDVGIPAVVAVSTRSSSPQACPVIGFGAHLDPRMAVLRALTEVNQFLPGLQEKPDGTIEYRYDDRDTIDWFENANLETDPYLAPTNNSELINVESMPQLATDDLRNDVYVCRDQLKTAGLDMLALDLTRPDIGFPVAKVMSPGLCHMWRRLGSQRLYEVPVKMGWITSSKPEEALNPRSVFF